MRHLLIILLCFLSANVFGIRLSEQAQIRVMTMGPDQAELYSAFGHSGIRITDPLNKIDWVYNYGVFDFNQPNFYLNFARGKLLYKLGKQPYDRTKQYYVHHNRFITEQILALESDEKQKLFDFLEENARPENRDYYYNYIYDNCATKIRDVLEEVFPGKIVFGEDYVTKPLSYRDLMDLYLAQQPWGDVGIDICLGAQIDEISPARGYMFLPDFVQLGLEDATIERAGVRAPLVADAVQVYRAKPTADMSLPVTPVWLFSVIFLIAGIFTHRELKYGLWYRTADIVIFSVVGIVGWLLVFLWFGTDHLSLYNFNLLWAIPFHFPFSLLLLKPLTASRSKLYFLTSGAIALTLIPAWGLLPQALNIAFVPIVLLLAMRSLIIYLRLSQYARST